MILSCVSCGEQNNQSQTSDEKETSSEATTNTDDDDNLSEVTETTTNTDDKKDLSEVTEVPENKNVKIESYICLTNNKEKSKRIWVGFDENGKAAQVKYEGQKEAIQLVFDREEFNERNRYSYYNEMYKGKVNGRYKLTHSGIWDYIDYTRGKDGKEFSFTIDHDANPYGKEPCF